MGEFLDVVEGAEHPFNTTVVTRQAQDLIMGLPLSTAHGNDRVPTQNLTPEQQSEAFDIANSLERITREGRSRHLDQLLFREFTLHPKEHNFGIQLASWQPLDFYPLVDGVEPVLIYGPAPDNMTGHYMRVVAFEPRGKRHKYLDVSWANDGTVWLDEFYEANWMASTIDAVAQYSPRTSAAQ